MDGSRLGKHIASVFLFAFLLALAMGSGGGDGTASSTPKTPEEARKELVEKYFDPWDGSHRALTKLIKESMNDPDSYKHVETRYVDKGDYLIVTTKFRGKNAFGGVVLNSVTAKVDLDGKVVEVISQGR